MNREPHYTYTEAADKLQISVRVLKAAAALRATHPRRLKVKRYGHRTVRIPESELQRWDSCRIS